MATKVDMEFAKFEVKLSLTDPVSDYIKIMNEKMKADVVMPHDVYTECWKKISTAARDTIWKMLFDDKETDKKEQLEKASEFLQMHKEDACFYQASEYNKWIATVRGELLKREMLDFWRNEIVQKELGPCWARDSDLFDDPEDPEPANFYNYADCKAPWLDQKSAEVSHTSEESSASALSESPTTKGNKTLKKITKETPLEDYVHNVEAQGDIDGDDDDAYREIFAEAREMIWEFLFGESTLSAENYKKAAVLLEEYKRDACFYNPWDYNDWLPSLRDEILKRKYFDFWQDVVVKKELGLCWAGDSDYFDDKEDPDPTEFFKVAEDIIKSQKK